MPPTDEEKEAPGGKPKGKQDPIVDRSLAGHFFLASALLAATVAWAIVDEFWLRRPWKAVQAEFVERGTRKAEIEKEAADAAAAKQQESAEAKAAKAVVGRLAKELADSKEVAERNARQREIIGLINTKQDESQIVRGEYQPLVYEYEHALKEGDPEGAAEIKEEMDPKEKRVKELQKALDDLREEKNAIQARLQELRKPLEEAQKRLHALVPALAELEQIGLRKGTLDLWTTDLKQVYSPIIRVVDRCQSCHVAADKPGYEKERWTDATLEGASEEEKKKVHAIFTTHPNFQTADPAKLDYLSVHPVQDNRFGCTSCHLGNGPAANTPEEAHGLEGPPAESWQHQREFELFPMLGIRSDRFGSMTEGTCLRCHETETYLLGAEQLTYGRQLIEDIGCWGCHKIKGFETKELERENLELRLAKELIPARDEAKAEALPRGAPIPARAKVTELNHEIEVAERRLRELDQEIKFIGPDLNRDGLGSLKAKVYARWLPRWIHDPHAFRPGTWMPNPLLNVEQAIDVAAYVWQQAKGDQSGVPADIEALDVSKEVAAEGRKIVESRGCLACHTLDEKKATAPDTSKMRPNPANPALRADGYAVYDVEAWWEDPAKHALPDTGRPELRRQGSSFGPSLARVGEKIHPKWMIQWLRDPKSVQPHTRMPDLRLTAEEAEKVALFLSTLRKGEKAGGDIKELANLDVAKDLESRDRATRGLAYVKHYGCFNCHAMDLRDPRTGAPVPNPGKIGAELSSHGSKPLAQFDFGFLHVPEYRPVWLMTKLLEPRLYDRGKYKASWEEWLRMPRFGLTAKEAAAITTVLVGLVDEKVPKEFQRSPDGREAAIIEGERLVAKFNCRSCHVGDGRGQYAQAELLEGIFRSRGMSPRDPRRFEFLPPLLTGQGHKTEPDWLFRFLKDPGSLAENPKGKLRPALDIHMPTFDMSDAEAAAIVEYFSALTNEAYPYFEKDATADDPGLVDLGRQVFVAKGCASCHLIGSYTPPGKPIEHGPNLAYARERFRRDWLVRFIPDPWAFAPGVNMASAFGEKPYGLQPPEVQREIQAVVTYVRQLADPAFREKEKWVEGGQGPPKPE